jgi:quercetin dioxygenase-like cupin family protein
MFKTMQTSSLVRAMSFAGVIAGALLAGTSAFAGECPADKMGVNLTKKVDFGPKDVTDTVLASIDLAKEPAMIDQRALRLRKLVVQPGGIVPWHSHGDRPAIIYIISGEVTEYASTCAVPILHKAGDVATEKSATAHWWKNTGTQAVVLLSADILHDTTDHNM